MKKTLIIIAVIIAVGFLIYKFTFSKTQDDKTKAYTVKKQTLKDTLSFSGQIGADEKASLNFMTSGKLAWVGVKQGDYVKKYQALASLDQRELEKNLKKYLNTYITEKNSFEQNKDDYKNSVITDSIKRILDTSQQDLNNSVIDVEVKNLALEYVNIYSPIDGIVVTANYPLPGINISSSQTQFVIVNPSTLYFSAIADQTEVTKLRENQRGNIVFDAYPDNDINGTISSIAFTPKEGETSTVYEVKVKFDPNNIQYRLGMTGDVTFDLRQVPNAISIPENYVKTEGNKKYILIDQRGNETKRYVELGETIDGNTIIKSGLKEGDIVYD